MKIRSITSFYDPCLPQAANTLHNLAEFTRIAADRLGDLGYEIQTARLATTPFCTWDGDWLDRACDLEKQALSAGFQYLSIGPADLEHLPAYQVIPDFLSTAPSLFATGMLTDRQGNISLPAVRACAEVMVKNAAVTPDGFTNLRFAALANVPAFTPFLPAAYHQLGESPACAIAVECADLVINAFQNVKSCAEGREKLITTLESEARTMHSIFSKLCDRFDIQFKGFDFSPAPYPRDWCSLAGAMEMLGLSAVGLSGSLAAAAYIADTLDRGCWLRAGFNGLFLPVMEDSVLASRAADGSLTVRDLLLFSSVCGAGLDTVPLPGDSTPEQLSALLLDLAALSSRLRKPLTARLMPIPGKSAGDMIDFNFEFFAKSCVMTLPAAPLRGLFAGDENLDIRPRNLE